MNFDDQDTPEGFYVSVIRTVANVRGDVYAKSAWWTASHKDLGCSPLSAMCDGRRRGVDNVIKNIKEVAVDNWTEELTKRIEELEAQNRELENRLSNVMAERNRLSKIVHEIKTLVR